MHHTQLIFSEFRRNAKGNNEATIADRLLKIINLKRLKLPWFQSEPSLPTTAVIIPENPAKATDISAIDNNTSRFSVIKYHLLEYKLYALWKIESARV